MSYTTDQIRNFCIIAHIDHGKSTLADRFLELTGTVEKRKMKEQLLDRMELERERGITIKLKPVRMRYKVESRKVHKVESQDTDGEYILNLIDTPGHVDFSYEVSRSLAAVEGAILLVDASQGIQAQTLANLHLAQTQGLTVIPVINKIDLPNIDIEKVRAEVAGLLKCLKEDVMLVSGKTGQGVEELLEAIVKRVPPPKKFLISNFQFLNKSQAPNPKSQTTQDVISSEGAAEAEKSDVQSVILSGRSESKDPLLGVSQTPAAQPLDSVDATLGMTGGLFRALIFDSVFDEYRGVVAYVRVFNGTLEKGDQIYFIGTDTEAEVLGLGYLAPDYVAAEELKEGEIGYVITNVKEVTRCAVGDTVIADMDGNPPRPDKNRDTPPSEGNVQSPLLRGVSSGARRGVIDLKSFALPGYEEIKSMVFAGFFAESGEDYGKLRTALEKLKLTDASLQFEPEHSKALGFGFRCGFLGLLHLDIIRERLEREYDLNLVITVPSVGYRVYLKNQQTVNSPLRLDRIEASQQPTEHLYTLVKSPQELPELTVIDHVEEPIVRMEIVVPAPFIGKAMSVFSNYEGMYEGTTYLTEQLVSLEYLMPLSEILVDFYDNLKSATSGYASMNYDFFGYEPTEIQRLDILVAEEPVEALAMIVYKKKSYEVGRKIVEKLKEHLPRQMFEVKIQAAIGGKIIAAERLGGMKKNVLAKMSGGDYTRKLKLLQKQKKGKKRMEALGRVKIPQEVYLEILKR